jgi:hypothetical protein
MTVGGPVLSTVIGIVLAIVICALPGAVLFRLPLLRREFRAALPVEERVFWQVVLSCVWSVGVTLTLGAMSTYSIARLSEINVGLALVSIGVWRRSLKLPVAAPKYTASALLPLALVAFALWRFLPAAEYIMGGKDPGVYVNEGISLHRTGTIFRRDAIVAAVPAAERSLFFHDYPPTEYWGIRFMGVFLNNPDTGEVIPGFPHLLPASIALGYGVAGIRGATTTVVVWAVLGLLSVYFFGVRLAGRAPSFAACLLLGLNVIEVWYGRYPNAEVVMQTFVFAGLLAFSYAVRDGDRYFGWVAGALAAALIFLRFDAYLAIAGVAGAAALVWIVERRAIGWGAALIVAAASAIAWRYYRGPMRAYFWIYRENLPTLETGVVVVAAAIALTLIMGRARPWIGPILRSVIPPGLIVIVLALAAYGLFLRQPGGRLAPWDAYALRAFRDLYVFWPALITGMAGFGLLAWKRFWREPAFFMLVAAFSTFFFYKIRVPPEQFWTARRFLPVILPGLLLLAAAGALGVPESGERRKRWRTFAGSLLLLFIGWQYAVVAAPVAAHVEYRGAIRQVERLADRVTDRDLVIFESRNADSDMHVLALPLAYAYGHNVLVLESPRPERRMFETFLQWAVARYERVLFVASAGTDLLSRKIVATPLSFTPVTLPEYATSAWNEFPPGARQKDLGYCIYQLAIGQTERTGFVLDVGTLDDLHVLRFRARETADGRTIRWTGPQSFIAVTGLIGDERELTMVMHDGGRPEKAPAATVELFLNETSLGTIQVGKGFKEYRVTLPPEVVRAAAQSDDPAQLRIVSTTWSPRDYLGGTDDRALGVMIDRVEIH